MDPVWKINGRTVRMTVRPDTNDWNVCQSVIVEDEYGFDAFKPLSGVAIDVGAHIGAATVALCELNPELNVVAIEPVPENVRLLRKNTEPYAERVTIIEGAVGNGPQRIAYNWRGGEIEHVHRFIANQHLPTAVDHDEITVPGVTLSELVEAHGPIALLKIDAEGAERAFLDDPAIAKVERVVGEWHDGAAVRAFTKADIPPISKPRLSPEKRAARRKRAEK